MQCQEKHSKPADYLNASHASNKRRDCLKCIPSDFGPIFDKRRTMAMFHLRAPGWSERSWFTEMFIVSPEQSISIVGIEITYTYSQFRSNPEIHGQVLCSLWIRVARCNILLSEEEKLHQNLLCDHCFDTFAGCAARSLEESNGVRVEIRDQSNVALSLPRSTIYRRR